MRPRICVASKGSSKNPKSGSTNHSKEPGLSIGEVIGGGNLRLDRCNIGTPVSFVSSPIGKRSTIKVLHPCGVEPHEVVFHCPLTNTNFP